MHDYLGEYVHIGDLLYTLRIEAYCVRYHQRPDVDRTPKHRFRSQKVRQEPNQPAQEFLVLQFKSFKLFRLLCWDSCGIASMKIHP